MTNTTFDAVLSIATAAAQAAWGKAVGDALTAIGFPRTADTGQVDWSTTPALAAANLTAFGYEIRQFTDPLQASRPIVFKVEYGRGTAATSPAVWITVGTGSDGAGNITGVMIPRRLATFGGGAAPSATGYASSGDGSACAVCLSAASGTTLRFSIERSRDDGAEASGAGVGSTGSSSNYRPFWAAASFDVGTLSESMILMPVPYTYAGATTGSSSQLATGGVVPMFGVQAFIDGGRPWEMLAFKTALLADAPVDLATVAIDGVDRVYKRMPPGAGYPAAWWGASAESGTPGSANGAVIPLMWWA